MSGTSRNSGNNCRTSISITASVSEIVSLDINCLDTAALNTFTGILVETVNHSRNRDQCYHHSDRDGQNHHC